MGIGGSNNGGKNGGDHNGGTKGLGGNQGGSGSEKRQAVIEQWGSTFGAERWGSAAGAVLMDSDPAQALDLLRMFGRWAADALGAGHPVVAQAIANQAWCEAQLGRAHESCQLYRQALDLLETSVGTNHPASRRLSRYLAAVCDEEGLTRSPSEKPTAPRRLGGLVPFNPLTWEGSDVSTESARIEAAAQELGLALPEVAGPPGPDCFMVGTMMTEIGEFERAAEAFEEYEQWANGELGANSDSVLQAANMLSYCYLRTGAYAESCRSYERAKEMLERNHPGHPWVRFFADRIEKRCPPAPEQWFFGIGTRLALDGQYE
ncbi:MAG: hypothetical protein J2P57_02470, partial [Acidimicrobiaceae bacterium]|nr:hypothetical protein [Acidimicrobiaceae bacterium]